MLGKSDMLLGVGSPSSPTRRKPIRAACSIAAPPAAACALDDSGLAVGDTDGQCHVLDRNLAVRATFASHSDGVMHLMQPRGASPLLTSCKCVASPNANGCVILVQSRCIIPPTR